MHLFTQYGAALALLGAFTIVPASAQVTVKLYNSSTDTSNGVTFGTLNSTVSSPQISFLTDTNNMYYPIGMKQFGADMSGTITAPATGLYTFTLTSDDGSYLFLNGLPTPFINDGGNHFPQSASNSITLTANTPVVFDLQFNEDGTIESGVDLSVTPPGGVSQLIPSSYFAAPVPEASTTISLGLLLALGLGGLVIAARRKKAARPAA